MDKKYFTTVAEFQEKNPAKTLMKNALKELKPTKGNRFGFIISVTLAAIYAVLIGFSETTVESLSDTTEVLMNIHLALFGCIFAVYSILLAFLSDGYMKRLARINEGDKVSYLKKSTTYYESVLFLYFICIGLSGIVLFTLRCLDPDFRLSSNIKFDNAFASVLIFLFLFFSFRVFYELKSTIYNTVILFRASIAFRFLDFIESEKDDNEK